VNVRIPSSLTGGLYGADYASRIRWVELAGTGTAASPATSQTDSATGSTVVSAQVTASGTVIAAVSGPVASNGAGDFSATPLRPSSAWQVSAQTGSFSWSYPMRVPPAAAGPEPEPSLSYDSGSVDGETGSTNNQAEGVGNGWQLGGVGGFIERSYVPCATDGAQANPPTNEPLSGDECWKTDNATVSFPGRGGPLVRDKTTGTWHLMNDDGSRVERLNGASNGDNDGEYWKITTTDGTQYFFGRSTASAWTMPVFGDDANEPCHAATFAASVCTQAWRWNLDYVVDPHGNAEAFKYTRETNLYRENNSAVVSYVRGGELTEVDYGMRDGSSTVPQRVLIEWVERCAPGRTCSATDTTTHTAANYPDTPWDQSCTAAPCTGMISPTFWLAKMTSKVHTQLASGTSWADVDAWTLGHSFPATNDGTAPSLWMTQVGHTGYSGGTSISLSNVIFYGNIWQNRVWAVDGLAPLNKYRLYSINTETGATVSITYSAKECTPAMIPDLTASLATNTKRCFPQWWAPQISPPQPAQLDFFHKYVVTEVSVLPNTGGPQPQDDTFYDYTGTPGWRYDDSPLVPNERRTWSIYAGYDHVRVRHGDAATPSKQQTTEYTFFRGLNGDRGKSAVTVTASDGSSVPDDRWLGGFTREAITYNGNGGARVSNTITTAWASGVTADDATLQARRVADSDARTYTALSAGGDRVTETKISYDSIGRPVAIDDLGDVSTSADDKCTRTSYADNTTAWLRTDASEIAVVGRTCAQTPTLPQDAISDTRLFYDNGAWGAAPSRGNVTRSDSVDSYTGSTPHWLTTASNSYDPLGRTTSATDPRISPARTTMTSYTPSAGPVTSITTTNPLGWTTTTKLAPAWGAQTSVTDENNHVTEATFDALGRRTQVWLPDRPRGSNPTSPSYSYAYTSSATAPTTVATTSLTPLGDTVTSYALFDGLLRPRQTQAPAEGGGRVITDTFYDSAGQAVATNRPDYADGNPSGTLFVPTLSIPSSTQTVYDGAGRKTAEILLTSDPTTGTVHEQWRTSYSYGGDHVTTTPPAGGTTTTTYTDTLGDTTMLQQWHAVAASGAADTTRYAYDHDGRRTSMTDNAGNVWTWTYDVLGRQIASHDPDNGDTVSSYDAGGRLTSSTDGRGQMLAYSYDALDRKTGEFKDSLTGPQLASWTYDTIAKGQLSSSTRFVGSDAYTTAVTGYDAADRPTGSQVSIPSGPFAGTYQTSLYYAANGALSGQTDPAGGGLSAERLRYGYDALGMPSGLSSTVSYLAGVTYNHINQPVQTAQQASSGGRAVFRTFRLDPGTDRLTELLTQQDSLTGAIVSDRHYSYTDSGDITAISDMTPAADTDTQCFTYDYASQLSAAWTPASANCSASPTATTLGGPAPYWQSFSYDTIGNRLSATRHAVDTGTDLTDTYTYPTSGAGSVRPHAVQTITHSGGMSSTYGYDAAGNTTARPGQTLAWDAEDRLATVSAGTQAEQNIYDADGNLLISNAPSGTTLYLGDTELHASGGVVTGVRTYAAPIGLVAERTATAGGSTSQLTFTDPDPEGTATARIDPTTGTVTRRYFDPFGSPRGAPVAWPDSHGYLNKPTDAFAGTTHLGARDYDPSLGRFLSVDPQLDSTDPQAIGGYSYAENSPVSHSDPTGLAVGCID
jgi:RHS repeat-associated protein